MGKHCEGPEERDPYSHGIVDDMSPVEKEKTLALLPGDKQEALLQAIRALSSQVEALQLEQHILCNTVNELQTTKATIGGRCRNTRTIRSCQQQRQQLPSQERHLPSGTNSGSGHPVSGTVLKAVKASAYVDFVDLLPRP